TGISEDTFGYKNPVTREQLVLMVYQFMQMQGVDVSGVNENKYNACGDTDRVHSWAVEAMKWALDNEIVTGTGTINGAAQISPRSTATRAQIAVIVKAMLNKNLGGDHPVGSLTLGEYDISEFAIVYGETAYQYKGRGKTEEKKKERAVKAATSIATELETYIENATGVSLAVYADTELPAVEGAKEILVGKTNREEAGLVTVDRTELTGDALLYEMKGNYLIIASNELYGGTYMARTRFLEEVVGMHYYDKYIQSYESIKEAVLEDGVRVTDNCHMEYFCNYQYHGDDTMLANSETYMSFGNAVHSIPGLACTGDDGCDGFTLDYSHHTKHHMENDPCLSELATVETIIKNVKTVIEASPESYLIWVSQSDNSYYCKCKNCSAVYRTFGRGAPYLQLLKRVGEEIADEYPDHKVVGLAYMHTMRAPYVEISDGDYADFIASYEGTMIPAQDPTCPDNVVICVCTDTACASHAIDDPDCKNVSNSNVKFNEYMERWNQLVSNVYLWDYVDGSGTVPYPNILEYRNNYNYFYEHGVNGLFAQANTDNYPDFAQLRTYLIAKLAWHPDMTAAEFDEHLNGFLEASYGPGWTYIREYIEQLEELSSENEWHIWHKYKWNDVLTEEQWDEHIDYLAELWEKALNLADNAEQRERIEYSMTAIRVVAEFVR
ncbi:MAG: DUF4838 domain-containing protein, partial [Clostridia bacterium]|nr:DUF4838 domain-containing protein [Clostridia bacterium]